MSEKTCRELTEELFNKIADTDSISEVDRLNLQMELLHADRIDEIKTRCDSQEMVNVAMANDLTNIRQRLKALEHPAEPKPEDEKFYRWHIETEFAQYVSLIGVVVYYYDARGTEIKSDMNGSTWRPRDLTQSLGWIEMQTIPEPIRLQREKAKQSAVGDAVVSKAPDQSQDTPKADYCIKTGIKSKKRPEIYGLVYPIALGKLVPKYPK